MSRNILFISHPILYIHSFLYTYLNFDYIDNISNHHYVQFVYIRHQKPCSTNHYHLFYMKFHTTSRYTRSGNNTNLKSTFYFIGKSFSTSSFDNKIYSPVLPPIICTSSACRIFVLKFFLYLNRYNAITIKIVNITIKKYRNKYNRLLCFFHRYHL